MQKLVNKEKACCENCYYYDKEVEKYGTYHWCVIESVHIPTNPDNACEDCCNTKDDTNCRYSNHLSTSRNPVRNEC